MSNCDTNKPELTCWLWHIISIHIIQYRHYNILPDG